MSAPSSDPAAPTPDGPAAGSERRQFYRLLFPYPERPRLTVGSQTYEVLDCSVYGLRYVFDPAESVRPPALGDWIQGSLQFRRALPVSIRGLIVRIQYNEVALYMPDYGIPFATLWSQERYLLTHYPTWERQVHKPPNDATK